MECVSVWSLFGMNSVMWRGQFHAVWLWSGAAFTCAWDMLHFIAGFTLENTLFCKQKVPFPLQIFCTQCALRLATKMNKSFSLYNPPSYSKMRIKPGTFAVRKTLKLSLKERTGWSEILFRNLSNAFLLVSTKSSEKRSTTPFTTNFSGKGCIKRNSKLLHYIGDFIKSHFSIDLNTGHFNVDVIKMEIWVEDTTLVN